MSDGKIKSKAKSRWKMDSVIDRCTNYEGAVSAQVLTDDIWSHISGDEFAIAPRSVCITSTAQMSHSFLFIEQIFEKQQGIVRPKMTTYRLCDASVKGQVIPSEETTQKAFPTQRLVCSNKNIVEVMREKMAQLVHIIEQRSRHEIIRLCCVFVVEDLGGGEYKARLHHTREVEAGPPRHKGGRNKGPSTISETRSEISEVTNLSHGCVRRSRCAGDFCTYSEQDEGALAQMQEELNFNIAVERDKARKRHQRVEGSEEVDDVDDEDEANIDIHRATVLAATTNVEVIGDGTPGAQHAVAPSQSYKVPVKSLLLARNEMKLLDVERETSDKLEKSSANAPHWWPLLISWYHRTGHALVQKSLPVIPASCGHRIGKAMLQIAEGSEEVSQASPNSPTLSTAELTSDVLRAMRNGLVNPSSTLGHEVPFDLSENPYHNSETASCKHLGRYYSTTSVCERCYTVYKELDRLRKEDFRVAMKNKKLEAMERSQSDALYLAERIDNVNKLANQRVTNFRLAKSKNMRRKKGEELQQDSTTTSSSHSRAGAPKGVLPPMPWQLREDNKRHEYQQQGSSFIKGIHNKAQRIANDAARRNKLLERENYGVDQDGVGVDPSFDWRRTIQSHYENAEKSKSAGNKQRKRQEKVAPKKKFNSERLLHPYQRYFEALKRGETGNEDVTSDSIQSGKHQAPSRMNSEPVFRPCGKDNEDLIASSRDMDSSRSESTLPPLVPTYLTQQRKKQYDGGVGLPPRAPVDNSRNGGLRSPTKGPKLPEKIVKNVSFSLSSKLGSTREQNSGVDDDGDDDDDDDDDDEIGWSPFVVA